jgi:hypothetical protein
MPLIMLFCSSSQQTQWPDGCLLPLLRWARAEFLIQSRARMQCGVPTQASWIQDYVDNQCSKFLNNHTVAALAGMHSKCGDLESAHAFCRWNQRDLICYSSMTVDSMLVFVISWASMLKNRAFTYHNWGMSMLDYLAWCSVAWHRW